MVSRAAGISPSKKKADAESKEAEIAEELQKSWADQDAWMNYYRDPAVLASASARKPANGSVLGSDNEAIIEV